MSNIAINEVILSSDENPNYIDFWPIVAKAYKKIIGITPQLAFLTEREEDDPYITELRTHGKVTIFKPVEGIPHQNQAKVIRHYLASMQGDLVCYIDDIDLLPLNGEFIRNKVVDRPSGHLLCVGAEFWAYGNNGCFPVSQMTAEGYVFKSLFNPRDLPFKELLLSWAGLRVLDPAKENILNDAPSEEVSGQPCFSDEYLIRYLRSVNKVKEIHKPRGFDWETQTADRGLWLDFREEKLKSHQYVFAHCLRPYSKYKEKTQPLIDYIDSLPELE